MADRWSSFITVCRLNMALDLAQQSLKKSEKNILNFRLHDDLLACSGFLQVYESVE